MSEFRLVINTDNAAFDDANHGPELARILQEIASRLAESGSVPDGMDGICRDVNGNRCGYWSAAIRAGKGEK